MIHCGFIHYGLYIESDKTKTNKYRRLQYFIYDNLTKLFCLFIEQITTKL